MLLMIAMPGIFLAMAHRVGMNLLLLILTVSFSLLSGYVTARTAPCKSVQQVLALTVLSLLVGIFVQVQYWESHPLWYHFAF